jgi:hypothetical protein
MLNHFTPPPDGKKVEKLTPPASILPVLATITPDTLLLSADPKHPLPNRDLDTGHVVQPGGYSLTDFTYALLLHRLAQHPEAAIPPGIKRDIQTYYANADAPIGTKKNPQQWAQVQADLTKLASMATSTELQPYPTYGDEAATDQ